MDGGSWERRVRGESARAGFRRCVRRVLAITAVLVGAAGALAQTQQPSEDADEIRRLMVAGEVPAGRAADSVLRFYEARGFEPAWTRGGRALLAVYGLRAALKAAASHGLRPEDYHLQAVWGDNETELEGPPSASEVAARDVLLTDAFLELAEDLQRGRVEPGEAVEQGNLPPRQEKLWEVLQEALATDHVREALEALAPTDPGYEELRGALARYRAIEAAGGWEPLGGAPTLHQGDSSPAVERLRRRLFAEGYLPVAGGPDVMDDALAQAVRTYQARNGLEADGIVGRATRASLDIPAATRVAQIEASLERWRWREPASTGRYLRVNTAAFRLEAVEGGRVALAMAVVVGTPENPTPSFTGRMTHLVLNPSWNVPPQIAREEFLPELQRDPLYLTKKGFQVLRGWDPEVPVDPASVNWTAAALDREGLHFRQQPGLANALGRLKFLFPNRFHVYLHDTPSRGLFAKARRDFSHGCIRVAEPVRLAEYLLAGDSRWSPEALEAALARGEEKTVLLAHPVPVRVEYATAWVDEDGAVNFRDDIYGRDELLVERLRTGPPTT